MKRDFQSILLTLPLMVLTAFFLMAAMTFGYSDWLQRQTLLKDAREHLLEDSARFVRQVEHDLLLKPERVEEELLLHGSEAHNLVTALIDADGSIRFAQRSEWKGRVFAEVFPALDTARFARAVQSGGADLVEDAGRNHLNILMPYAIKPRPGQAGDARRGAIYLEYDLATALAQSRYDHLIEHLPVIGLALLFATLLIFWLKRRVVQPIRAITEVSRRVSRGDLAARIDSCGIGEVAVLCEHFNIMTEALGRELASRKSLSAKLQESHDLLAKISAQVPGIIFQFRMGPDGHSSFPFISETARDMYGFTPEQAREDAAPYFAVLHPDDADSIAAYVQESSHSLSKWDREYRVLHPKHGVRWHMGHAQPERQEDGSILWHGFITDVTERKRSEERRRLNARVFETVDEAIMVTDAAGSIVAVNPAFSRITGYSEAEVLGKNPRILNSNRHDKAFHQAVWQSLQTHGKWAGEIWNRRKNGEVFPEWQTISSVKDANGRLSQYVAVFADLSEIRKAQEAAEHLSWRDSLTGLANRALFLRQLGQTLANAHREGRYADVLLLDLDRFKDINEARGLALGDALLKEVAECMTRVLHPDDLLARLDSDEFAVLLPRLAFERESAGREALAVAEKLREVLRGSIVIDGEAFHLDASIGIALFPESAQETASDVLRQADMAMHQAKAAGGGCAIFFEAAMGQTIRDRYRVERELRLAIDDGQLRLYLQPQVDAAGGQVGAEALVRWQHPERGLVPPGVFIPLAEATDLIVAIDRWMLAAVCRLLARLDAEGCSLRVSVNISPRHFQKEDFVDEVKRHLAASGADPTHLVLEVTEGLVIGNFADVVAKMMALTELGIHFSMDDFGTGYSSLAYLKRLPIHELKIDKSFIDDVTTDSNDAALVDTILAVAQHLGLQVVAEGVETQAQVDFLNAHGQVIHQGYLYGRPEPMETWLAKLNCGTTSPDKPVLHRPEARSS
ncbi:MAG: EAL domain-containing protein [Sterolibacterium sp.]